jgi:predicted alpha/beta hydrolase family esterase
MPVLFYSVNILFNKGIDVACIEYAYSKEEEYNQMSHNEQREWLFHDVSAAYDAITKEGQYESSIFVGKSLGTIAVGNLLNNNEQLRESNIIWLTPILHDEELRKQITESSPRSLFVIGTEDPFYDEKLLNEIKDITKGDVVIIPNANHSLEIADSIWDSLQILETVLRAMDVFLKDVD